MAVAQERQTIWTPQVIVLSIIVHVLVLYYAAVAFNVVPPAIQLDEATPIILRPSPPPPPPPDDPDPTPVRPLFQQRLPATPPVQPQVQPTPLLPTITPMTGPASISVDRPIDEQPVSQLLPRYPRIAETKQIEGKVRLTVTIMPDGSVRDVRVLSARPQGYFEAEAVRAVQQWRYAPSAVIRTNVVVDIDFVLN